MTRETPAFVSFEPDCGQFRALLSVEGVISIRDDPELVLKEAAKIYKSSTTTMLSLLEEIQCLRSDRKRLPARTIWRLGDAIFRLQEDLGRLSLQLDGLYDHLVRDLRVKRKRLEKVIIFRRYLPDESVIPLSLNWGRCEKGTRRAARRLSEGLPPR